jgi:tRNA1(Val) A37 N6-methylase TrmN6
VTPDDCTLDRFLGGRIIAAQPKQGFRAGHDTVLVAAAVAAKPGESVLELGAGAGIASLCLASRVQGARVYGIEIDPELVHIANENAGRNRLADRVLFATGNAALFRADAGHFAHIFFNPPFHPAQGTEPRVVSRDRAKRDSAFAIAAWTSAAVQLCERGGTVTAILRADRVDEMLTAAGENRCVVYPLYPRRGQPPKRVIVQIMPGKTRTVRYANGLVLHRDSGSTDEAEAVLRHGEALRVLP